MLDAAGDSAQPAIPDVTSETYTVLGGRADAGLIILCDHAANTLAEEFGSLGLPPDQLRRHIAYDIGAAEVTRRLAAALGVPAVMTRYSRLLIDPNRGLDDPTLIMRLSDGAVVPGNRALTAEARRVRIRRFWEPYHDAIGRLIDESLASGVRPALLSMHSFTESWKGVPRPWHAGVLWDRDARLAPAILERLFAEGDIIAGDNEPYSGRLEGDTMWRHGTERGLPHALVELRQDLIRDAKGQAAWAARLERILRDIARAGMADLGFAFRDAAGREEHDRDG